MNKTHIIMFCSPAGTTAMVADTISQTLTDAGEDVKRIDLAHSGALALLSGVISESSGEMVFYIGSPVYGGHIIPPVASAIDRLPGDLNATAMIFATWGCVTSGIALFEMAGTLTGKGIPVVGAVSISAEHSMTWAADTPVGSGRPNREDLGAVATLVKNMMALPPDNAFGIAADVLAYQPEPVHSAMSETTFDMVKARFPEKTIVQDRCTECGICVDVCPVSAITIDRFPVISDACISCLMCVKACPDGAILSDMETVATNVLSRQTAMNEPADIRVFFVGETDDNPA